MKKLQSFTDGYINLPLRQLDDGSIQFDAEQAAIGMGISQIAKSGNEVVRWERVNKYLSSPKVGMQISKGDFITEPQFYELAIKANSKKAKQFQYWVTHDVLPSIRKHGAYMTDEKAYDVTHNPDGLADLLLQAGEQLKQKNLVIEEMKPKANYFDDLVERNLLTNFRDTAKELHIGQKKFIEWLLAHKYVYRDQGRRRQLKHYAKYDNELFEFRESVSEWSDKSYIQSLITPKGRATFKLLLKKDLTI